VYIRRFGLDDGLRSVRVSALAEDQHGVLWIGTTGGGLSRWDNGRFTTFGPTEGFPTRADIISMAVDSSDTLWIGTADGLVRRNPTTGAFTMVSEEDGMPRLQIRALAVGSQGRVWVSALDIGVFVGTGGKFERVQEGGARAPEVAYSLLEDRRGRLWAGDGNGLLWCWRDKVWERFDTSHGLPHSSVVGLAEDRGGTLWLAARGGVYAYDEKNQRFDQPPKNRSLTDQRLNCVAADREGSVWIGTVSGGLNRLSPALLQYWGAEDGLNGNSVSSIAEDRLGAWWAGTPGAGIFRFDSGRFGKVDDPAVGQFPLVYCVATTEDGTVWAAGEQYLARFQMGQPTKVFTESPIKGDALRALCPDGDVLWIGTYYSTLLKCDADGIHMIAPRRTFGGDITCIVREAPGTLWIGTSTGLHRWEHGKIARTWDTGDGLPATNVRSLMRDPDGTVWIGTLGGGLARLKDGRFTRFTTRHGLIDDVISQITSDEFGGLWLGCNRGLMRVERWELDAVAEGTATALHLVALGRNEGMTKVQCSGGHSPTTIKTRDGRLLFPTVGGVAEVDPRRLRNYAIEKLEARIETVVVDGVGETPGASLKIAPGRHRLEFHYTAPALRGGEWVRFRHRLKGRDATWVFPAGSRTASYDELRPGNYEFRVEASDGRGNWHGGSAVAIAVQPHVWQTLWFRLFSAIFVVGLSATTVWAVTRRRHQRKLEQLRIARKHEAELAHASRVSLLGELSASLSHELKQPLAAILTNAQAALRFLEADPMELGEVRNSLEDITTADRRANEIIGKLRSMMKKGEAEMVPCDLNADIQQVLVLLHSDLVERNTTVETRLSPDLPLASGDHIQLQQVLLNLIINGCDSMSPFSPADRRLEIETLTDKSGYIQVRVRDHGVGVPAEKLEHIFEPFYTSKEHGLGMGLSICRAIIKAHGGHLSAIRNQDRGTTFGFTLRTADHADGHSAHPQPHPEKAVLPEAAYQMNRRIEGDDKAVTA
jgi:signal transduction histidine kinase/ligand-binding sensor domain-containing protein